jgi:3-oxoacyl-[acyl-carrier protein] reductase
MPGRLEGRTAIVTGAGSGMGRATALALAAEGAPVAALDIDAHAASETAQQIIDAGDKAIAAQVDVSDAQHVTRAIGEVRAELGEIEILVNNAGVFDQNVPCLEATEDTWDRVLAINLKGLFLMTRGVLGEMLARGHGAIVNMASVAGQVALGGGIAYTTSKAGVIGFTKQVACEAADRGVRVNAVAPGLVYTNLFDSSAAVLGPLNPTSPGAQAAREKMSAHALANIPLGRGGEPEEVARAAVFLASDDASYITGTVLLVDGGYCAR